MYKKIDAARRAPPMGYPNALQYKPAIDAPQYVHAR